MCADTRAVSAGRAPLPTVGQLCGVIASSPALLSGQTTLRRPRPDHSRSVPPAGAEPSPALLVPSAKRRSRKTSKDTGEGKDGGAPGSEEPGAKARGRGRKPSTKAKGGTFARGSCGACCTQMVPTWAGWEAEAQACSSLRGRAATPSGCLPQSLEKSASGSQLRLPRTPHLGATPVGLRP